MLEQLEIEEDWVIFRCPTCGAIYNMCDGVPSDRICCLWHNEEMVQNMMPPPEEDDWWKK